MFSTYPFPLKPQSHLLRGFRTPVTFHERLDIPSKNQTPARSSLSLPPSDARTYTHFIATLKGDFTHHTSTSCRDAN